MKPGKQQAPYQNADELVLDMVSDPKMFLQARESLRNKYLRQENYVFLQVYLGRIANYAKMYGMTEENVHLPGERVPGKVGE